MENQPSLGSFVAAKQIPTQIFADEKNDYVSLQAGEMFDRYQVYGELGRGGMGIVYKAYDTKLQRQVALKVILRGCKKGLQRFAIESKAMARLQHPNIVDLYDYGKLPKPFIVMEYIDGFTLEDLINKKKISLNFLLPVLGKICNALTHAHGLKVIHRDIKPSNIMITNSGEPKIMDFGLAKTAANNQLSASGEVLGSILYMSPEQLNGNATVQSDIYSLGAIMYEAITYCRAHQGDSYESILFHILQSSPLLPRQINRDLSPYLEAICMKCMEKNPSKRYINAKQLARDLKNFGAKKPIIAKKYTRWHLFQRFIIRHKLTCAFTFLLFAVLTGALFLVLQQKYRVILLKNQLEDKNGELEDKNNKLNTQKRQLEKQSMQLKEKNDKLASTKEAVEKLNLAMTLSLERLYSKHSYVKDREIYRGIAKTIANSPILRTAPEYAKIRQISMLMANEKASREIVLAEFNSLIEKNPKNSTYYFSRASLYGQLGKYNLAIKDYSTAIFLNPNFGRAYLNRGTLYSNQEKYQLAERDLKKAIIYTNHDLAYINLGALYNRQKKYQLARDQYEKAIKINPLNSMIYNNQGDTYKAEKKYNLAEQSYTKAITVGNNMNAYYNRGDIYYIQKKYQKAINDWQKAIDLKHPNSSILRGKIRNALNKMRK